MAYRSARINPYISYLYIDERGVPVETLDREEAAESGFSYWILGPTEDDVKEAPPKLPVAPNPRRRRHRKR